ncbi:TRPL translocation defect protein 14 [Patella vulgata]|uniref:TRPL translocation defect protein 14 n=1 Tax=Patella vulgata TaxID=6465 RepID=UPI00218012EF|nr:TRPL translocation defect protein 14 [Patella vulgata]
MEISYTLSTCTCTMRDLIGSKIKCICHESSVIEITTGPCGGKTTGQARLSSFFENLGWKVFRSPEAAMIYLSGGVKFSDLDKEQIYKLQENIIKTMLGIENTYHDMAKTLNRNILLICDRGVMDGVAYIEREDWDRMKAENKWNDIEMRDNRYNQIIHMVSASKGAEAFYTITGHKTRGEDMEMARELDTKTANSWVGHPYFDVIDNSTGFETKLTRMIAAVCDRLGVDAGDRLQANSKKRKFLVSQILNGVRFPFLQEFQVVHDYLVTPSRKMQARLRRRGQNDHWTYTHTIRRPEINKQSVELRQPISSKEYEILQAQRDGRHDTIYKTRQCFLWQNQYFQMDIYRDPCPSRCKGLILLETYTAKDKEISLPDFLKIEREVTDENFYSMFSLSLKDEWRISRNHLNSVTSLPSDED